MMLAPCLLMKSRSDRFDAPLFARPLRGDIERRYRIGQTPAPLLNGAAGPQKILAECRNALLRRVVQPLARDAGESALHRPELLGRINGQLISNPIGLQVRKSDYAHKLDHAARPVDAVVR